MTDAVLVLTTWPNAEKAVEASRKLVEERLAACANILTDVRSVYRWEGKVQDEPEVLVLVKTQRAAFERLKTRVLELHPYQVPEVIAVPVEEGHPAYLAWIASETTS